MAFNLSGTTITQTGTDTNLSGLTGIAGVTTVTDGIKTIYTITNLRLKLEGTLTLTVRTEKLIFDGTTGPIATNNGILYLDGATFNIDGVETINGVDIYSEAEAIRFNRVTGDGENSDLITFESSILNWNGGKIYADGRIATHSSNSGGALNITNGILDGDVSSRNAKRFMIRAGLVLNVNGLILKKAYLDFNTGAVVSNLSGLAAYGVVGGAIFQESGGEASRIEVTDYEGFGNQFDFGGWTGGDPCFINALNNVKGSDVTIGTPYRDRDFGISILKEVDFEMTDTGGAVENAKIFMRDHDDGARHNAHSNDFTNDETYIWTTLSTGKSDINRVLIAEQYGKVTASSLSYRSKNGDNTDLFDFSIWSYKHNSKKVELSLKGAGVLTYSTELFPDANITEQDESVVSGYTGISITHPTYNATGNVTARGSINIAEDYNLNQLYDFVKYNKTLSVSIEFPNVSEMAISVNATELRLHEDYDLVGIENLSSSDKFNKITATGSISNTAGNTDEPLINYEDSADATFETVSIPDNSEVTVSQTFSGTTTEILHLDATSDIASRFVSYKKASTNISVKVKYGLIEDNLVSNTGGEIKHTKVSITTSPVDDLIGVTDTDFTNVKAKATFTVNASNQIQIRKQGSDTVLTRREISLLFSDYIRENNIPQDSIFTRSGSVITLAKELNTDIDLTGWETIVIPTSQSSDLETIAQVVVSSPLKAGTIVICSFSATNGDYSIYGIKADGTEAFTFEKITGNASKVVALPENTEIRVGFSKAYHDTQIHTINTGGGISRSYTLETNNKISENETYTVGTGQNIELSNPTNGTVQFGLSALVFSNTENYKAVLSRAMVEEEYLKASVVSNNKSILTIGDTGQAGAEVTFQPLTANHTETVWYIKSITDGHILYTAHSSNNKIFPNIAPITVVIEKDKLEQVANSTTVNFQGQLDNLESSVNTHTDSKTLEIKNETDKLQSIKDETDNISTNRVEFNKVFNSIIATTTSISGNVTAGSTEINVTDTSIAGTYNNHYIVINDGSGNPIQRSIINHTTSTDPITRNTLSTYSLNNPIGAVLDGLEVFVLIRTTSQDGIKDKISEAELHNALNSYVNKGDWKATGGTTFTAEQVSALTKLNDITTGTGVDTKLTVKSLEDSPASKNTEEEIKTAINNLTTAEKEAFGKTPVSAIDIAAAVEDSILNETDGKKVIEAIVNAIDNENITATAIATAVWGASSRELTSTSGLTSSQNVMLESIKTVVDKLKFDSSEKLLSIAEEVKDKTGYELTSSQISDIATAVETATLDDGDGKAFLQSIKDKIAGIDWSSTDIPLDDIVNAVWNKTLTEISDTGSIGEVIKNNLDEKVSAVKTVDLKSVAGVDVSGVNDFKADSVDLGNIPVDVAVIKQNVKIINSNTQTD